MITTKPRTVTPGIRPGPRLGTTVWLVTGGFETTSGMLALGTLALLRDAVLFEQITSLVHGIDALPVYLR